MVETATASPPKPKQKLTQTESYKAFIYGVWEENPIFRMVLGICSSLAVTNRVLNTLVMNAGVVFVICCSSVMVSMIRNITPRRVRMPVYTVIIATFVVVVDQVLKAFLPAISEQIGAYVGLIITNCIIMGRCEAYASSHGPKLSFMDALGVGLGYSFSLLVIALIREPLGFGTLLGFPIMGPNWTSWVVMVMSPGAFLVLGVYVWAAVQWSDYLAKRQKTATA